MWQNKALYSALGRLVSMSVSLIAQWAAAGEGTSQSATNDGGSPWLSWMKHCSTASKRRQSLARQRQRKEMQFSLSLGTCG